MMGCQSYSPRDNSSRETLKSPGCTASKPFLVCATMAMPCVDKERARQRPRSCLDSRLMIGFLKENAAK
jgi:hypothetical protein